MTHGELVAKAGSWLLNKKRCVLILEEPSPWAVREFPDAIGWTVQGYSILVECKTSRSDFARDKHKSSKGSGRETMGRERWYLTPQGVLTPADMPPGVGLMVVVGRSLVIARKAAKEERPGREAAELPLLIWATRKEAWNAGYKGRKIRLVTENVEAPDGTESEPA